MTTRRNFLSFLAGLVPASWLSKRAEPDRRYLRGVVGKWRSAPLELKGFRRVVPGELVTICDLPVSTPRQQIRADTYLELVRLIERHAGRFEARRDSAQRSGFGPLLAFLCVHEEPHAVGDGWEATICLMMCPSKLLRNLPCRTATT